MFEHRSTIHWRKFSEISDCREPSFLQTLRGCRISYLDTAKNICPALSIFVSLSMLSFPNLELLGWQCLASRLLRARGRDVRGLRLGFPSSFLVKFFRFVVPSPLLNRQDNFLSYYYFFCFLHALCVDYL